MKQASQGWQCLMPYACWCSRGNWVIGYALTFGLPCSGQAVELDDL